MQPFGVYRHLSNEDTRGVVRAKMGTAAALVRQPHS